MTIPVNTVAPAVTGSSVVGGSLSVNPGTWLSNATSADAAQWFFFVGRGGDNSGAANAARWFFFYL